jgi:hypothetical protein
MQEKHFEVPLDQNAAMSAAVRRLDAVAQGRAVEKLRT